MTCGRGIVSSIGRRLLYRRALITNAAFNCRTTPWGFPKDTNATTSTWFSRLYGRSNCPTTTDDERVSRHFVKCGRWLALSTSVLQTAVTSSAIRSATDKIWSLRDKQQRRRSVSSRPLMLYTTLCPPLCISCHFSCHFGPIASYLWMDCSRLGDADGDYH